MTKTIRALLVEDDEHDAALILASLKSGDTKIDRHRVWTRPDLEEALPGQSWDVVLCDYNLPQFDGLSALDVVKAHDPDLPFIIVSGAIGEETAVAMMRRGAQDFVMKQSLGRLNAVINREMMEADVRRAARLASRNLQANEALLNSIINTAADGIALVNVDGQVEFANPALARMIGCTIQELHRSRIGDLLHTDAVNDHFWETLFTSTEITATDPANLQTHAQSRDGCAIPVEVRASRMIINAKPKFTILVRDISERARSEEQMWRLSHFDELSGLPNRLLFSQLLEQALREANRVKKPIAVLFIDLDRFKLVNDAAGHEGGDAVLQQVTGRLRQCLRESDVLSRFGSDEFAALMHDLDEPEAARAAAERVLRSVAQPYQINGEDYHLSASIGISTYPSDSVDAMELLRNAELAMYRAKDQGKNNFQFHSPQMNRRSAEHIALERALRRAVELNEFLVYYQPQVELATGRVIGAEALLRWNRTGVGLIEPDKFIPLAEETGLIVPIGHIVLAQACAEARRRQNAGAPDFRIAVNLSPRQFTQNELVADVQRVLKDTGLAPECLELEITESMVMDNPERAAAIFRELRETGVQLAIDDFGTGYSSLSYLKRFPVNTIKIDRSFIKDLPANAEDSAITRAIIAMGHSLRLSVVAEGVEVAAQAELLRASGCDVLQGYLISEPGPAEDLGRFLQENPRWHLPP